jgi:hypothetical protein
MIRLPDLMASLDALGVKLSVELRVDAPRGIMTPALREVISEVKTPLLVELTRRRQWRELQPLRWGGSTPDDVNIQSEGACRDLERLAVILRGDGPDRSIKGD